MKGQAEQIPDSQRHNKTQTQDDIIVGTNVESDRSHFTQIKKKRTQNKGMFQQQSTLIGIIIVLCVIIVFLFAALYFTSNTTPLPKSQEVSKGQKQNDSSSQGNNPASKPQTPSKPPSQNPPQTKPVDAAKPVNKPIRSNPPVQPTKPAQIPKTPNKFNSPQQKFIYALNNFNPWDLSVETKKYLLRKYKQFDKKDPNTSPWMPIVQNYDEEVQTEIDDFDKNIEVINYESNPMTPEERSKYTQVFEEKLRKRLIQKRRERDAQRGNNNNPDGIFSAVSKITRGQWFRAFEYHTLVGVNLAQDQEARKIAEQEVRIYEEKYQISQYPNEIAMCIVTPSYNNIDHDRYLWTLESIYQQNYTNFRMVILDDASPDKTYSAVADHLRWRNASQKQFIVVKSTKNHKPMGNIFYGSQKYCNLSQIQYVVDGDDELVGRQVFKVMNAYYQKEKMLTVYSSHIIAGGTMDNPYHYLGISKDYFQDDIDNNNFKKSRRRGYHHLRTMMSDTILLMRPSSFKDWRGLYYWAIGDNACYYPAMEMSCKKVKYLNEIFYIYNYNTGQTEDAASQAKRADYQAVYRHINDQKSYRCLAMEFLEIAQAIQP